MLLKKILLEIWHLVRFNRSYAQDGEDIIFEEFWKAEYGNKPGFFVEIGGYHPVRFSNTFRLYRAGWHGIVVEPTPRKWWLFALLRPRDILAKVAAGSRRQIKTFFCFTEGALNKFATEIQEYKERKFIANVIPVQQDTIENILDTNLKNYQVDLLSIDIEGMEMDALEGNNWEKYQPKFIIIEDKDFRIDKPEKSETYRYLTAKGYKAVAKTRRNVIYQMPRQLSDR